ncbi:MAG: T9SS type A sorting domain-containing protein, partial [Proteobacteria bacterium]|nr:T9SS type A sorting domain-containing protein [Pseudomonadota bacterium]
IVGFVDTPGYANGVAVLGTHAYVADRHAGVQVIDITNPAIPQIVGSVGTPGEARSVVVLGSYAYVASYGSGLQVIDITNPEEPQVVGGVDTPDYSMDVVVSGTLTYVADNSSGLQVLPTQCGSSSGVGEDRLLASSMLLRAAPNPSSHLTTIHLSIRDGGLIQASAYDLSGRLVRRLAEGFFDAGVHDVTWDGCNEDGRAVAAGIYQVRVATTEGTRTARVVILR